jgi:hypothetical protein
MTTARYASALPTAERAFQCGTTISADLRVVCLCSAFGLVLSGLFFAAGFGAEIARTLMAAG